MGSTSQHLDYPPPHEATSPPWLFKAPSSSVHCKHGKGDHWKGGRNGTRRGAAFIFFFLGLPDTVQDLPWGRGWEAHDHGVPLWVLWLSQGIGTCIIVILVCFSWGNFLLETTINGDLMLYNCLCLCMQYAHRECVQRWCDEKGSTLCEICLQVGVSAFCSSIFLWKFSFSALSTKCHTVLLVGWPKSCH